MSTLQLPNQKNDTPNWPTIKDAVAFVRASDGLRGWTDGQITQAILKGVKEAAFAWNKDTKGNITGLVFGHWKSADVVHVTFMAGELKTFMKYLHEVHPQCKRITAIRRGKPVEYNLDTINI